MTTEDRGRDRHCCPTRRRLLAGVLTGAVAGTFRAGVSWLLDWLAG